MSAQLRKNTSISAVVLAVYRFGRWVLDRPKAMQMLIWPVYRISDLIIVKVLAGADIPAGCSIGHGLLLAHGAKGTVLSHAATIGEDVTIYHQVTVAGGARIGNNVWIGPGAKVLENVVIGASAKVGANAVVNGNVPEGCTAVGVPMRIIPPEQ
jgi:serine O-acetyltransferase